VILTCELPPVVFHVVDHCGNKVRDEDTLQYIQKVCRYQTFLVEHFKEPKGLWVSKCSFLMGQLHFPIYQNV
jgi:hypothetical protein